MSKPVYTQVLFDSDADPAPHAPERCDALSTGLSLTGGAKWSVRRRQLAGGPSDGVDVVDLCSGPLTVSILPTRGMGLWKAECDGVAVGWNSPVKRPVHPRHVNLASRNGLGWLDGFNELLCRCGLAFNGPPGHDEGARSPIESELTLHGRIANTPAHRVEASIDSAGSGRIAVSGVVEECTLFGPQLRLTSTVTVEAGGRAILVEDRVENLAASESDLQLLYHINVGRPFLEAGAKVCVAAAEIAPRDLRAAEGVSGWSECLGPTPGYAEQAYFLAPLADSTGRSTALLRNRAADRGLAVSFAPRELPCLTLWKCTQAEADGYVAGIEPGVNYPNFKAFEREQGRVVLIPPGGKHTASLQLEVLTTPESIAACEQRIAALQATRPLQVHERPAAGFSPQA